MKRTFIIILVLVVLLGAFFYFWSHRYDYFFKGKIDQRQEESQDKNSLDSDESIYSENEDDEEEIDEDEDEVGEDFENGYVYELSDKPLSEIVAEDCSNGCENQKGEEDYAYCLEICGLKEDKEYSSESECDKMSGLAKDNCFRNLAVSQKNFSFCQKISDDNLKEACKNRVSEEIMDSQKLE